MQRCVEDSIAHSKYDCPGDGQCIFPGLTAVYKPKAAKDDVATAKVRREEGVKKPVQPPEFDPFGGGVVGSSLRVGPASVADTILIHEVASRGTVFPRIPVRKLASSQVTSQSTADLGNLVVSSDSRRDTVLRRPSNQPPPRVPIRPPPSQLRGPRQDAVRVAGAVTPTFEVLGHGVSGDSFAEVRYRRGSSAPPGRSAMMPFT